MIDQKAASRMPHVIVEVSTPHEGPEVYQTLYCGVRVVKGEPHIKWSDGHTE